MPVWCVSLWRVIVWRVPVWRVHDDAISVWHVSLWRDASLPRVNLAHFSFLRLDVYPVCNFVSAKECCLRQFGGYYFGTYLLFAYFSFVRHIFINLINVSS